MNKKIGVVGNGYVGKTVVALFKDNYKVFIYDPEYAHDESVDFEDDERKFRDTMEDLNHRKLDLAIICVPTEMREDGSCDTSIVEEVVKEVEAKMILIKSTVPPGTTDRLKKETGKRIVFSPEFAGESKYWSPYKFDTDMKESPWYIFGGEKKDVNEIIDLFAPILGPTKKYNVTDAKTAELVKYWENTFFAMKVTFCNEMYEICEKMGIEYWEARELWLNDPRVNKMHTAVFKENRGYGGKCFPKDTNGLVMASKKAGYVPELLEVMIKSNDKFRQKNKE